MNNKIKLFICTAFFPLGVIPAKAEIHKIVVLLQLFLLDPRFRGDDTEGLKKYVFSYLAIIASNKSATILMILIMGLIAGPAVSL